MIGIGGIDFDVEEPVDGRGLHVGREGVVVDAALRAAKDGFPGCTAIGGAEDVFSAFRPGMAEGAGDDGLRVVRIDGNGCVAEFLAAGYGLLGSDLGPRSRAGVELPNPAAGHARGARRCAVGDVEGPVGRERGACGAVLRGLAGDWFPASASVGGDEEIRAIHQRDADVNGLGGGVLFVRSIGRNEFDEDNTAAANRHALPPLLGCFARDGGGLRGRGFADVGKAGDAHPGHAAIAGAPKPVVARA